MQLYAMYRDGHAPAPGALALLTDFFSFQLARFFGPVLVFFLHHAQLIRLGNGVWLCFAFGAVLNLLVVVALCGAVFSSTGPSHSLGMADAASAPPFSPARRRLETLGRKAVEGFAAMYQVLPYP